MIDLYILFEFDDEIYSIDTYNYGYNIIVSDKRIEPYEIKDNKIIINKLSWIPKAVINYFNRYLENMVFE